MPSRRAVLALLATAPLAGCGGNASDDTAEAPLADRTVAVAGDLSFPPDSDVTMTDDASAAEALVLPAAEEHAATAVDALDRGTPVVFAGRGAPALVFDVCEQSDRPYGLPSDGWTESERAAAVVPTDAGLDTQYLEPRFGADPEAQLQWALGEVLGGSPPDVPVEEPPRPDGVDFGWVRVRGRTDVGDYDRWDRVTHLPERRRAVVETVARVDTADESVWNQYRVDGVAVQTSFLAASVEATGRAASTDGLSVNAVRNPERRLVEHEFSPTEAGPRRSFSVAVRTVVSLDRRAPPFAYIGNVRFRWRRRTFLRDDSWVAHTPGRAVWRGGA
jgi:hypothetical protein